MKPHQKRVVEEKQELDTKLAALMDFTNINPIFEKLPSAEKGRLLEQRRIMREYSEILGQRIRSFTIH